MAPSLALLKGSANAIAMPSRNAMLLCQRNSIHFSAVVPVKQSDGDGENDDDKTSPSASNTGTLRFGPTARLPRNRAQMVRRVARETTKTQRADLFYRLFRQGVHAMEAYRRANAVYEQMFEQNVREEAERWGAEGVEGVDGDPRQREAIEAADTPLEREAKRFVEREISTLFNLSRSHRIERLMALRRRRQLDGGEKKKKASDDVKPEETVFSGKPRSDAEREHLREIRELFAKAAPKKLDFWAAWDRHRAEVMNQGLGPRNALEEHIVWTKQAKMWPYPIDNEWRFGPEADYPFTDHVFLEPEWRAHGVPKSRQVEHFMELVLTGLSKNPYMTVKKKREHIRWFAGYFRTAIESRYRKLLVSEEEFEATRASAEEDEEDDDDFPDDDEEVVEGKGKGGDKK